MSFGSVACRNSTKASPKLEYLTKVVSDFRDATQRGELEKALAGLEEAKASSHSFTEDSLAGVKAALAAQKGGATDGTTVQKNLMAVSGSTKGKECDSYKACLALLKDGKEIQYKGQTSIGAFNDAHDPSSASIGVYKYDADNKPVFDHSQEGSVPKA